MVTERWQVLTEVIDALTRHMSDRHRKRADRKGPPLPAQNIQFVRGSQAGLSEAVKLVSELRNKPIEKGLPTL